MHTRTVVAALAGLLLAAPVVAQQPTPPKGKPTTPTAAPAVTPAPAPKPAPAPSVVASSRTVARVPARRPQLEVTGGVGTAVVDLNGWAGQTLADWNKMSYWGAGRVFFPLGATYSVGAEVGYHYHFWWSTPSGSSWNYTYSAAAAHAAALLRVPRGRSITGDLGAGFHFFSAGVKPGLVGALSYRIPVGANLAIPVGVRADAIFTNPILVPVVLNAGVGFTL